MMNYLSCIDDIQAYQSYQIGIPCTTSAAIAMIKATRHAKANASKHTRFNINC